MKKTIIAILLLSSVKVQSQKFSIIELIKINRYDIDKFDTYVTQKGFKFFKVEDGLTYQEHSYKLDSIKRNGPIGIDKYVFTKFKKDAVNFSTYNSSTYLDIKKELNTLGFIFIKKENNSELRGTSFLYQKNSIQVTLSSSQIINTYGETATAYEISVEDPFE